MMFGFTAVVVACTTSTLLSTVATATMTTTTALEAARALVPPPVLDIQAGETEGVEFWATHRDLLRQAWKEWENAATLLWPTVQEIVDPNLYLAVAETWRTRDFATGEKEIRSLWKTAAPEVYSSQLLAPDQIYRIRQHLDAAENSTIPRRRPNGMNRYGLVLNPEDVDGVVSLEGWDALFAELIDTVVRPVARLLFPQYLGQNDDDVETYAFTIRYKVGEDIELKEHADASTVTLNLNLNLPGEINSSGISDDLFFLDGTTQQYHNVTVRPGQGLIHRGMIRHGAYPTDGRMQLVVWLMGRGGYARFAPYDVPTTALQRWTKPNAKRDPTLNWGHEL